MKNKIIPTKYFAGGFLYNPDSNLILLHLRDGNTVNCPNAWSIFGGSNEPEDGGSPENTFIREIKEELDIILCVEKVVFLRDFFSDKFNIHRFSFYGIDQTPREKITLTEGADCKWCSLDEAFKLGLGEKTKEDLIIFEKLLNNLC